MSAPTYLTAAVTIAVYGEQAPTLYILPQTTIICVTLAQFLGPLACVAGSKTGWMTAGIFEQWAQVFVAHVREKRQALGFGEDEKALLFLDDNASRNSPTALSLLEDNHVLVICIPTHVSHILQPFDVGVAEQMNSALQRNCELLLPAGTKAHSVRIIRTALITAIRSAIQEATNLMNCIDAFEATGLFPRNVTRATSSTRIAESQEK